MVQVIFTVSLLDESYLLYNFQYEDLLMIRPPFLLWLKLLFFFLTPRSLCSSHTHLLDAVLKHGRHWLFILPRIFFLQIFSWLTLTLFKPLLKCLNEAYSDYGNLHLPSFYLPFYILKKHFNLLTYYIILVCLLTYKNPTKKILRTGIFVLFTDISPVSVTVSTE